MTFDVLGKPHEAHPHAGDDLQRLCKQWHGSEAAEKLAVQPGDLAASMVRPPVTVLG